MHKSKKRARDEGTCIARDEEPPCSKWSFQYPRYIVNRRGKSYVSLKWWSHSLTGNVYIPDTSYESQMDFKTAQLPHHNLGDSISSAIPCKCSFFLLIPPSWLAFPSWTWKSRGSSRFWTTTSLILTSASITSQERLHTHIIGWRCFMLTASPKKARGWKSKLDNCQLADHEQFGVRSYHPEGEQSCEDFLFCCKGLSQFWRVGKCLILHWVDRKVYKREPASTGHIQLWTAYAKDVQFHGPSTFPYTLILSHSSFSLKS